MILDEVRMGLFYVKPIRFNVGLSTHFIFCSVVFVSCSSQILQEIDNFGKIGSVDSWLNTSRRKKTHLGKI